MGFTKLFVSVSTACCVVYRRDGVTASFLLGAAANAVASKALKALFATPRPHTSNKTSFGFPSSHAMSLAFFAAFLVRWSLGVGGAVGWGLAGGVGVAGAAFTVERVRSGHHTAVQCVGGAVFGGLAAWLWMVACPPPLTPAALDEVMAGRRLLFAVCLVVCMFIGLFLRPRHCKHRRDAEGKSA